MKHLVRFGGLTLAGAAALALVLSENASNAGEQQQAAPAPAAFQFYAPPANRNLTGIYWITSYSPRLKTIEGQDPPYKPEYLDAYRKRDAAINASANIIEEDQARRLCTPDGLPRVLQNPYPWEIVQADPNKIWILYELNKIIRLVHMDKPLPDEKHLMTFPYYSGHSAGRWEGDDLVIETGGFKDYTFLDNSGAPHSDQLRVTERYRKINDGRELEVLVTIRDPVVFTREWQTRFTYARRDDIRIQDWNCGEPHRTISHIPGVRVPQ
jgi:hypothetical protein